MVFSGLLRRPATGLASSVSSMFAASTTPRTVILLKRSGRRGTQTTRWRRTRRGRRRERQRKRSKGLQKMNLKRIQTVLNQRIDLCSLIIVKINGFEKITPAYIFSFLCCELRFRNGLTCDLYLRNLSSSQLMSDSYLGLK